MVREEEGQAYESGARVYPEVVSECSVRGFSQGVSGSSVRVYRGVVSECGCTDLRARGVSECLEPDL